MSTKTFLFGSPYKTKEQAKKALADVQEELDFRIAELQNDGISLEDGTKIAGYYALKGAVSLGQFSLPETWDGVMLWALTNGLGGLSSRLIANALQLQKAGDAIAMIDELENLASVEKNNGLGTIYEREGMNFVGHALKRMEQRGFSVQDAKTVLEKGSKIVDPKFVDRFQYMWNGDIVITNIDDVIITMFKQ